MFYQKYFLYDKIDLRLFYFRVMIASVQTIQLIWKDINMKKNNIKTIVNQLIKQLNFKYLQLEKN